jgi:hypothetical protein
MGEHSFSWLTFGEIAEWEGWDQFFEVTREIRRDPYRSQLKDYEKYNYKYLLGKYGSLGQHARMVFGFAG